MSTLSATQRASLDAIADVLIPAALGMPCFTGAGDVAAMVDHVMALRPELTEGLKQALDRVGEGEDAAAAAERLNQEDPGGLATIGLVASSAYYMMPEVRRIMGYRGQEQRPATAEEENDWMRDDLLQPVIDRGPIYRDTDGV
ncbi:MAG: hypothetical protein P1U37_05310 [Minwuia sp.]|nr:hypothetical protein [Minwuia sp.]